MYNPPVPKDGHSLAADAPFGNDALAFGNTPEQQGNQRIRHLSNVLVAYQPDPAEVVIDAHLLLPTNSAAWGYAACTVICSSWASRCRS
jgi:hypothetical protein